MSIWSRGTICCNNSRRRGERDPSTKRSDDLESTVEMSPQEPNNQAPFGDGLFCEGTLGDGSAGTV